MPTSPEEEPSEKQLEILEFIFGYVCEHGFQPSQQEMAEHFGVNKNAVAGRLNGLEKNGLIKINKGRERAIQLLHVKFTPYQVTNAKRPIP